MRKNVIMLLIIIITDNNVNISVGKTSKIIK